MMKLRNKLEELGKMKGVNQDEKGKIFMIATYHAFTYSYCTNRSGGVLEHALQAHTEC